MAVVAIYGAEDSVMDFKINDPEQLFHPIEHAIICEWLGIAPPEFAAEIDILAQIDGPEDGPITLASDYTGELGHYAVDSAVARLVLAGVQQRLPQWAAVYEDRVELAREYTQKPARKIDFIPQFLFEINWANSGPGFSWPVAYNVAWLLIYNIYVVTESADSPDAFGYCDRAIGWSPPQISTKDGAHKVIASDWTHRYREWNQHPWVELLATGVISDADAQAWSDEVWGDYQW